MARHGLSPAHIGVVPGAAGGPKGLILGPLDRFLFGQWLTQSQQPVDLVGASIGAWRMATACLGDPVAAFARLERDYIGQHYELQPGEKRPSAATVSEKFGDSLQAFYGGRVNEVLTHPRYRLHIMTSRGRHVLRREHGVATPLGYLGAFFTNAVSRKALGAWLERVVFSSGSGGLPFRTDDYRTRQVALSVANFNPALQASCSIPFVLNAVHNIPGAPPGAYWDGGITDYHLHLHYQRSRITPSVAIKSIARGAGSICSAGQNTSNAPAEVDEASTTGSLVLYPHFQRQVVPGWLDKSLRWRHKSSAALDTTVLLAPSPDWVKTLPNGKLPDRQDFVHYGPDLPARVKAWSRAVSMSEQLVDEWAAWLRAPDPNLVQTL